MEANQPPARGRLAIAAGAAALLALVVVGAVALGGDDGGDPVGPPPEECVAAWNGDAAAATYGRHNFNFHDYEGALVTYLDDSAALVDSAATGRCAVIFPAEALDPEPVAAGQVLRGARWVPISTLEGVALPTVGELQVRAAASPNAVLEETGRVGSL